MRNLEIKTIFRAIDRMSRPLDKMASRLYRFTDKAKRKMRGLSRVADKVSNTIGNGLKRGFQVASVAALGFAAAGAKVARVGMEFEQSIVNAAVKFPGKIRPGTKAYRELEEAARNVGKTTEFMAKDGADALGFLAQAGFNAEQSIGSLGGVVDLATVSGVDLATASGMAADTLGALGMKSEDTAQLTANMARMNDVFAVAQNSANNSATELYEALAKIGRIGPESGATIETLSAMAGTLADTGVKGSDAGTAIRNIFLRLQAPTGAAAAAVKKFAGELYKGGKATDIVKVIDTLREKIGGLKKEEQMPILSKIFGARTVVPAMALMSKGAEGLDKFREKLAGAQGAAKDMANTMRGTALGSWKTLQSAVESATLSLFNLQDGALKGTIDKMSAWVRANEGLIAQKIGDFIGKIVDNFDRIVTTIKAIGATIATLWALVTAIKAISAVLTVVNLVMAANPVTLIVMAIVAAVAILAGLIAYFWDDIVKGLEWLGGVFAEIWDGIVSYFSGVVDRLIHSGPISWLIAGFILLWKMLKWVSEWIVVAWVFMKESAIEIFDSIIKSDAWKKFLGAVDVVKKAWETVKTFFKDLWYEVEQIFKNAMESIKSFFAPLMAPINALIDAKNQLIGEAFGGGSDEGETAGGGRQLVGTGDKVARSLEERNITQTRRSELTIKDQTGRAEQSSDYWDPQVTLQPTGSF